MKDWSTKDRDLHIAQQIMEEYAISKNREMLGLFELVVDLEAKRMDFQVSDWVLQLAKRFNGLYGADHGDFVTRQIISNCFTQGQTLH